MGYERYPRNSNPQGDYYGRQEPQDYGRDYGSGRQGSYSSARDYAAAGEYGRDEDRGYGRQEHRQQGRSNFGGSDYGRDDHGRDDHGRSDYGQREYGYSRYGQREQMNRGGGQGYRQQGRHDSSRDSGYYQGSYASDGHRFADAGQHDRDDQYRGRQNRDQRGGGGYGRQPQGYDYEDRGFFARAGDEVRSWFGDEDAERRREHDMREDERQYGNRSSGDRDDDYHNWRSGQIAALDRDYDEYRRENRSKFENEFGAWRTERQGQRDCLVRVKEHMEVVGSDDSHVGTVDHVRGDRILLTKNDSDAGGRHHTIPSRWISSVDDKVKLSKTADQAKREWRDAEENQAMFGSNQSHQGGGRQSTGGTQPTGTAGAGSGAADADGKMLNKSFSGTY